ncbi:MAG: FtsX-like permease family protein, partial [Vicinamibacterales bacterium]
VQALDADLPLFDVMTLDESLAQSRWPVRVFGSMFAIFAVIALMLATVGLYAVMAYSVTQRTREIGVRVALGAQAKQVRWLVARQALVQLGIGLALGMAGAFGVGQLLESVVVGISPTDPLTLTSVAALLMLVSIGACLIPARRATRLDPVTALRAE